MNHSAKKTGLILITILWCTTAFSQNEKIIDGVLRNKQSNKEIPYATVVLNDAEDSAFVAGTLTDYEGNFSLKTSGQGNFHLHFSHMSYNPTHKAIQLEEKKTYKLDTIFLEEKAIGLEKLVVYGERTKAKGGIDKTTFYVNKKMQAVSHTGMDVIKHLPGVQVDFMQNMTLNGSDNIVVLVDGKERDVNYLKQLDASQIDKMEVINSPGVEFGGEAEGAINIILKEKAKGIKGHVYTEMPTSLSEVYIFPNYSFSYGQEKYNIYTSYNGEISNFNIKDNEARQIMNSEGNSKLNSLQDVRQNNWSHRFHGGMDYRLNKNNLFNFYGFFHPYSSEHDGQVTLKTTGEQTGNQYWSAMKEDNDRNYLGFYSLYYKHLFNEQSKLTTDLSYYNLNARNETLYKTDTSSMVFLDTINNVMRPYQRTGIVKIDYQATINKHWSLATGSKGSSKTMGSRNNNDFTYKETILAGYAKATLSASPIFLTIGSRIERSLTEISGTNQNTDIAWLPYLNISFKAANSNMLKLTYNRTIYRPNIYHLNPVSAMNDPFTIQSGNPVIEPETHDKLNLNWSFTHNNNYFSTRIFYNLVSNAFGNLTYLDDSYTFINKTYNLGKMKQYGFHVTGAWKLFQKISLNPSFKFYQVKTNIHPDAQQHGIEAINKPALEAGFSAIVQINKSLNASFLFQYNSPESRIQKTVFEDPLYFISVDKSFNKKLKVGFKTAIPFKKTFTYYGEELAGANFNKHYKGNIQMSTFPLWLHISYQFSSGKKIKQINREKEKIETIRKKGF
jgi:hypothetical protein